MKEQVTSIVKKVLDQPDCRDDFIEKLSISSNSFRFFSRECHQDASSSDANIRQLADILIFKMMSSSLHFIADVYSRSPFYREFFSKVVVSAINSVDWEEVVRDLLRDDRGDLKCSQKENY